MAYTHKPTTTTAAYHAKALATEDRNLRVGYLLLAEKAADNPVIAQLDDLTQQQLRDVLEAVLKLLPTDSDDSNDADSTVWSQS